MLGKARGGQLLSGDFGPAVRPAIFVAAIKKKETLDRLHVAPDLLLFCLLFDICVPCCARCERLC